MESESPRKTRRARRRMRPTRVRDEPVGVESPTMPVQDIPDLMGAIIYDCRPPLLPVSLRLRDIGLSSRARPVDLASLAVPPPDDSMVIGPASPEGVVIPKLGVTSLDDSGTDLEDELLSISPLSPIVSPLTEPDETLPVSPSLYPESTVPAQPDPVTSVESRVVPLREAVKRPTLDLFPSFFISPAQSYYDPATSPFMTDLQDESGFLPPDSPATVTATLLRTSTLRRMEIRRTCPYFRCRCCLYRSPMFRVRCRS